MHAQSNYVNANV